MTARVHMLLPACNRKLCVFAEGGWERGAPVRSVFCGICGSGALLAVSQWEMLRLERARFLPASCP